MKRSVFTRILSIFLILIPFPYVLLRDAISINRSDPALFPLYPALQDPYILPGPPYLSYLPLVRNGNGEGDLGFYVSKQGSDSNPGTFSLPWKTIRKAANSVKPGDIVYIRGGTYQEYVSINRSGTPTQPIRFLAYPGENPIIDGENYNLPNPPNDGLLTLDGDWIEISGLEVEYSSYIGIASYGKHNTLSNVFAHHNWRDGVYLGGDYGTLQDSRIWRNSMHSEKGIEPGSSGVSASRDETDGVTEYGLIRRNVVYENWGLGINVHHSSHVTIEGNTTYDNYQANIYIHDTINVLCQRNFIYQTPDNAYMGNSGDEVGILMGEEYPNPVARDIQVINNIAYANHRNLFWYTGNEGGGMENVLFANNTFVNGSGGTSNGNSNIILDPADAPAKHINVRFENNIVYQQGDTLPVISTEAQSGITYSHNFWSKTPVQPARGTGDVTGDPLFSKIGQPYAADWFFLKTSSPAINAGLSLSEVRDDYLAHLRSGTPDMGALEYIP
jgi:hypothetical protein